MALVSYFPDSYIYLENRLPVNSPVDRMSSDRDMRIVFMGTSDFSVPSLERLVRGEHELVAVYTQPDKPAGRRRALAFSAVKRVALEHGIPVIQPLSFKEPQIIESLARLRPEVVVVAGFGKILPRAILAIPPLGCLNIHPSLLPRHRGPSPIQGAILAGDEWSGVSIILMDEGVDTGAILSQLRVAIEPEDTAESLTRKLAQVSQLEGELPTLVARIEAKAERTRASITPVVNCSPNSVALCRKAPKKRSGPSI